MDEGDVSIHFSFICCEGRCCAGGLSPGLVLLAKPTRLDASQEPSSTQVLCLHGQAVFQITLVA